MKRLAIFLLLAACASPEREAREARDAAASWSAAGAMLAAEWTRGHVSDAYARSTSRVAIEELRRIGASEAARRWRELEEAVQRGDREAARRLAPAFRQAAGR